MATDPRDSSRAVQKFLDSVASSVPDLGEPLSEDHDDPLLDGDRIELDDVESDARD